jgi:hypothetical protein
MFKKIFCITVMMTVVGCRSYQDSLAEAYEKNKAIYAEAKLNTEDNSFGFVLVTKTCQGTRFNNYAVVCKDGVVVVDTEYDVEYRTSLWPIGSAVVSEASSYEQPSADQNRFIFDFHTRLVSVEGPFGDTEGIFTFGEIENPALLARAHLAACFGGLILPRYCPPDSDHQ